MPMEPTENYDDIMRATCAMISDAYATILPAERVMKAQSQATSDFIREMIREAHMTGNPKYMVNAEMMRDYAVESNDITDHIGRLLDDMVDLHVNFCRKYTRGVSLLTPRR